MDTKYKSSDEIRFGMMGELMGMRERDNDSNASMLEEKALIASAFIYAEEMAPSEEAFGLSQYRQAFIVGFVTGYRYIEVRKMREKYGTR